MTGTHIRYAVGARDVIYFPHITNISYNLSSKLIICYLYNYELSRSMLLNIPLRWLCYTDMSIIASWYHNLSISGHLALVTRNQRKKPKFNPNYSYGVMSNNVQKCTKCAHMRAFWHILAHCQAQFKLAISVAIETELAL